AGIGDLGAGAVAGVDDPHELQGPERLAQRGAADAELARELALAGQPRPRVEDRLEPAQDAVDDGGFSFHRQVVRPLYDTSGAASRFWGDAKIRRLLLGPAKGVVAHAEEIGPALLELALVQDAVGRQFLEHPPDLRLE